MKKTITGLVLLLAVAGCGGTDDLETATPEPTATPTTAPAATADATEAEEPTEAPADVACTEPFEAEAASGELEDTGALLVAAVEGCPDLDAWVAAAEANPDAIADVDPLVYLANICGYANGVTGEEPLCGQVLDRCDELVDLGAAACLQNMLNSYAQQGWQLKAITSVEVKGRIGPGGTSGVLVTMERRIR